jgi:hypothetical protein
LNWRYAGVFAYFQSRIMATIFKKKQM